MAYFVMMSGVGVATILLSYFFIGLQSQHPTCLYNFSVFTKQMFGTAWSHIQSQMKDLASEPVCRLLRQRLRISAFCHGLDQPSEPQGSSARVSVAEIIESNQRMQTQLKTVKNQLHEQALQIEVHAQDARTDKLTQIGNRRVFDHELQKCIRSGRQSETTAFLLMLDVDHFKYVNDAHGHLAGDFILFQIARLLQHSAGTSNVASRYGGEEFSIIFPHAQTKTVQHIGEQIRLIIEHTIFNFGCLPIRVTASIGVTSVLGDDSLEDVVRRADLALYHSKQSGRNCGHWYDGQKIIPLDKNAAQGRSDVSRSDRWVDTGASHCGTFPADTSRHDRIVLPSVHTTAGK